MDASARRARGANPRLTAVPRTSPRSLPPQPVYYSAVPEDAAEKVGGTTGFMYLICLLANTMSMLLAWFFIFVSRCVGVWGVEVGVGGWVVVVVCVCGVGGGGGVEGGLRSQW